MIAYWYWNPSREIIPLHIPLLDRPLLWYGFFFALGFFLGYWVLLHLIKERLPSKQASVLAERMVLYVVIGTLIGARLGDVLFYQRWSNYVHDPLSIIRVWEGGLASHGAIVGILLALYLLARRIRSQFPTFSYLSLLDLGSLIAGLVGGFIRIGNFFNQEILGTPSSLPWAVIFGRPADGSAPIPRHPVQLYEAAFYFLLFFFLLTLWKRVPKMRQKGKTTGLLLALVFTFRFLIEFFKEEQSALMSSSSFLDMGQYLSLPLIALGLYLFFFHKLRH